MQNITPSPRRDHQRHEAAADGRPDQPAPPDVAVQRQAEGGDGPVLDPAHHDGRRDEQAEHQHERLECDLPDLAQARGQHECGEIGEPPHDHEGQNEKQHDPPQCARLLGTEEDVSRSQAHPASS
jgi:hypothetical protein